MYLRDLKLNQCFQYPNLSTNYYVVRQVPELCRTTVCCVNTGHKHNEKSDVIVFPVSSDTL